MNILQFENATMQALHEKAATVANAQIVYGPFVGAWWEHYLSVVIETAQVEQRVASSKDVAEIRGFYDQLAKDNDALTVERDELRASLEKVNAAYSHTHTQCEELQKVMAERATAEAARMQLVKDQAVIIAGLHRQLSEAATVNDKLRQELEDVRATTTRAVPPPATDAEALHDTAIEEDAGNVVASAEEQPNTTALAHAGQGSAQEASASSVGAETTKPVYDNPVTYTARRNPFLK